MNKRSVTIVLSVVIALLITVAMGLGGIKVANANKISSSIELGIKYLEEGNYQEAILEFSKVISIDDKHEDAIELLALTEDYVELEGLYLNKEYILAADLISKLKDNKYLSYIEGKVNEISINNEAKVTIINEINNLDSQIEQLISENKYQEAIDLINKYLGEDLKQEYLDKLNELMNVVNESKTAYEEEKARLEEEKRLEEERLAEEERKRQEEERMISDEAIREILIGYTGSGASFRNYDEKDERNIGGRRAWVYEHMTRTGSSEEGYLFVSTGRYIAIDIFTGEYTWITTLDNPSVSSWVYKQW